MSACLALLDAANLWFRSFYAVPESLTAPDGTPVNAVRGFTDTLAKLLVDRRPARLVVCLDADWRPAFRVAAIPSYKTHRVADLSTGEEDVPAALTVQVPIILELLGAAGLAVAQADGHEADDVIGALVAAEHTHPVEVISGDRDLFQLVRDEPTPVRVLYIARGWAQAQLIGPAELAEHYGLPHVETGRAYADMAALRGDPSDGLPGVTGVGEKTAAKLVRAFGSLEALVAAIDDPADSRLTPRLRHQLAAATDYLEVAPSVVRVAADAPVVADRPDPVPGAPADPERLAALSERWALGGSVERLLAALGRY